MAGFGPSQQFANPWGLVALACERARPNNPLGWVAKRANIAGGRLLPATLRRFIHPFTLLLLLGFLSFGGAVFWRVGRFDGEWKARGFASEWKISPQGTQGAENSDYHGITTGTEFLHFLDGRCSAKDFCCARLDNWLV